MSDTAANHHILVVEDDEFIRGIISVYLADEGYRVTVVSNGREMRVALASDPVDLVLMDLRLPGEDGFMLTRYLREHHDIGIIIITTRSETTDRVAGLECGADDYIVKPFAERELLARIRSVLRRLPSRRAAPPVVADSTWQHAVSFHGCELDPVAGKFRAPNGTEIPLTNNEARLLAHLAQHIGTVMSREDLMNAVLQRRWDPCDRSIDVLVTRLRQKIETDPKRPTMIRTLRGAGYVLSSDGPDRRAATS